MPEKRPNFVVVMTDQHAARFLGCMGDTAAETPNIDRLARQGVTFENAYCPAPLCVPARMAFMTARWPNSNRVRGNHDILGTDIPTFAHSLGIEGYDCRLVGRMHFVGRDQLHGFAKREVGDIGPGWPGSHPPDIGELTKGRGNRAAEVPYSGAGRTSYWLYDAAVATRACALLPELAAVDRPFCLVVGLFLPHPPYIALPDDYRHFENRVPPPRIPAPTREHPLLSQWRTLNDMASVDARATQVARTAYYALVRRVDHLTGRIMAAVDGAGLTNDTVFVYTSDHGEHLGERGMWWKNTFHDQSAKIPMVVRWPGRVPANQRRTPAVNLIDLTATMVDLGGGLELPGASGRSLAPILADATAPWTDETFSEFYAGLMNLDFPPQRHRMVRSGRWKLNYYDGYPSQLFDLETDPDELHDRIDDPACADVAERLSARVLDGWDPDAIKAQQERQAADTRVIRDWVRATQPEEPFRWRGAGPDDNWYGGPR